VDLDLASPATLARLQTLDHLNLENLEAMAHLENLEASAAHRQTLDHLNLDKVEAMDQGALVLRLHNKA